MQRHKSAEKAARKSKKANTINRALSSRIKTAVKNVLLSKDKTTGQEELKKTYSIIDKSVKVGLLHSNNAANKKSKLSRHVNALSQ
ncbi:MAG: 30S ribosomal protein S20 [Chitinispirillaceae bacterium]|nr:30S ribosomal protein S20 [Chitinispirillaceae bacterium]